MLENINLRVCGSFFKLNTLAVLLMSDRGLILNRLHVLLFSFFDGLLVRLILLSPESGEVLELSWL